MVIRESQFDLVLFQGDLVKVTRVELVQLTAKHERFQRISVERNSFISKEVISNIQKTSGL